MVKKVKVHKAGQRKFFPSLPWASNRNHRVNTAHPTRSPTAALNAAVRAALATVTVDATSVNPSHALVAVAKRHQNAALVATKHVVVARKRKSHAIAVARAAAMVAARKRTRVAAPVARAAAVVAAINRTRVATTVARRTVMEAVRKATARRKNATSVVNHLANVAESVAVAPRRAARGAAHVSRLSASPL